MNIIGINVGLHDSSACLVQNGKLIAFGMEERFTRKKHDNAFPIKSIEHCLKISNLSFNDIDIVANSWDYFSYEAEKLFWHIEKIHGLAQNNQDDACNYLSNLYNRKKTLYEQFSLPEKEVKQLFNCEFVNVKHHLSHAYSVFPVSGFKSCAVLVIDGSGELETITAWQYKDNKLKLIKEYRLPHSLGYFYGAITQFIGFTQHDEEWKVMGWAPYGKPVYVEKLRSLIDTHKIELNLNYFQVQEGKFPWYTDKLSSLLDIEPRQQSDDFQTVYADIAASAQILLEECFINISKDVQHLTKEDNLCLAGGVALNGKATGVLLEQNIFKNIFVQPAASDDGTALGAALKVAYDHGEHIQQEFNNIYLGTEYHNEEIKEKLEEYGLSYNYFQNEQEFSSYVANKISAGNVIGWFQGRSELGPRALGNRSILADPRNQNMKDIINRKIKYREPFRPFAPSVLEEYAKDYFDGNTKNAFFMNQIFKVKEEVRHLIPAVTHVDNTARIQIVTHQFNDKYYNLIKEFYAISGIPMVINTSFNIKGEPNVETPIDAIKCFLNTGIDILVIGNFVISKKDTGNESNPII